MKMPDLPSEVIVKDSGYYLPRKGPGRPISLGETRAEALRTLENLKVASNAEPKIIKNKAQQMRKARDTLYYSMLARARKRNMEALDRYAFDTLWEQAGGCCQLTGIPFSFENPPGATRRPWTPSLDRKDARRGYTIENTRLVCTAVNIALNEWGDVVLMRIAEALTTKEETTSRAIKVEKILRKALRQIDEIR